MDNKNWVIKKSDGKVYGPVDTDGLKEWIGEGRIAEEDVVSEEGKFDWKKTAEIPELSSIASTPSSGSAVSAEKPQPVSSMPAAAVAGQEENMDKYGIGFGLLNILIGGFMFFGGIVQGSKVLSLLAKEGRHLRGLGQIIKGAAIFGLIVVTVLWLPLFISGILILMKKVLGRKMAVTSGQILTYAIPISFFISAGFRKIFTLYGLIVAILFVYVFIMWQNLIKPEFDNWFTS